MTDLRADVQEHENKCQRCGICCRVAAPVPSGRQIVVRGLSCIHLSLRDSDGRPECSVYEERFQKASWCLHSSQASPEGGLSVGCGYRDAEHPGKEMVSDKEYAELWPQIVPVLLAAPDLPAGFTWAEFCKEVEKWDVGFSWSYTAQEDKTVKLRREPSFWSSLWTRGEI